MPKKVCAYRHDRTHDEVNRAKCDRKKEHSRRNKENASFSLEFSEVIDPKPRQDDQSW